MSSIELDVHAQSSYTHSNRRPRCLADHPQVGGVFFSTLLVLATVMLTGCAWAPARTSIVKQTLPAAAISKTAIPKQTSTSSPWPTTTNKPSQTQQVQVCNPTEAVVISEEIPHPTLPQPLPYRIYLPPCYRSDFPDRYPSLYLLHGLGATDRQWDDLGIDEAATRLILDERTLPFIIVMPSELTGVDMEQMVVEILVPYIERTYRVRPDPHYRAIGGLSRGAGFALRIGLKNPDLFRAIGLHSPGNLYSAPYIALWVSEIPAYATPEIRIDIGESDPLIKSTRELMAALDELGLAFSAHIQPGEHDADYWSANLIDYLLWYTANWEAQIRAERQETGLPVENDPRLIDPQP